MHDSDSLRPRDLDYLESHCMIIFKNADERFKFTPSAMLSSHCRALLILRTYQTIARILLSSAQISFLLYESTRFL
jgi:hypothetical protein